MSVRVYCSLAGGDDVESEAMVNWSGVRVR